LRTGSSTKYQEPFTWSADTIILFKEKRDATVGAKISDRARTDKYLICLRGYVGSIFEDSFFSLMIFC